MVKQKNAFIIERLGKFNKVSKAGLNFKIPILDSIAGRVNLRVRELPVEVDEINKDCLVKGLDDIGSTLERSSFIDEYEKITLDNFAWRNPVKD